MSDPASPPSLNARRKPKGRTKSARTIYGRIALALMGLVPHPVGCKAEPSLRPIKDGLHVACHLVGDDGVSLLA